MDLPVRKADNPASPEAAFRTHAEFILRLLRRLGVFEAELDDALQDVFLVVIRRFDDFEGRSSFQTWLYGIALRVASDRRKQGLRRMRRHVPLAETNDQSQSVPLSSPARQGYREQLATLALLLDELDEKRAEILVLVELEQLDVTEAAEILELPLNTAYSRLRRARADFSAAYSRLKGRPCKVS